MIPLFRPSVSDAEVANVTRVLKSGWWAQGPETETFEREFASYVNPGAYPVAVSSGTAALEIAARVLIAPKSSVVVVPALTFISTALAMIHAGHYVRFADIDEETLCIDWEDAARKLPAFSRGSVVPVWYSGRVASPPPGFSTGATIIEDCAHAAGSYSAGKVGNASCWSFHAVKNLAAGDGGMILFQDEEDAVRARKLRWLGIDKSTYERDTRRGYGWDYNISEDGQKAHMNDLTAALARAQLARLNEMNARRKKLVAWYYEAFRDVSWIRTLPFDLDSSNHMMTIRVPAEKRPDLIEHLRSQGVSAGVHYKPLYYYENVFGKRDRLPVTERVWRELVTLPLFPDMTELELEQVIGAVRGFRT